VITKSRIAGQKPPLTQILHEKYQKGTVCDHKTNRREPRLMFHVKQFSNEKKLGLLATNMAHALVASGHTPVREKRSENSGLRTV
jgi:hypothetical protein